MQVNKFQTIPSGIVIKTSPNDLRIRSRSIVIASQLVFLRMRETFFAAIIFSMVISCGNNKQMPAQKDYLKEWEMIVNAHDLRTALTDHFSYLAEDSTDRQLLDSIISKAKKATFDKDKLIIYFDVAGARLIATPPLTDIPEQYPATYKTLLSKHRSIEFLALLNDVDAYLSKVELGNHPFRKKGNGLPYLFFIHTDDPPVIYPQRESEFLEKVALTFELL